MPALSPMNPKTKMNMNGKTKLKMTAEGFLVMALKLALLMDNMALI
jgi:hypothetical protein